MSLIIDWKFQMIEIKIKNKLVNTISKTDFPQKKQWLRLGFWLWLRVVLSNHLASSSDPRLVVLFESSPRRVTLVESSSSSQRVSWSNSRQVMVPHRVILGESSCVIE